MGYGVCNCVGGPPPHGICGACGAAGQFYQGWQQQRAPVPSPITVVSGLTAEQVREIVREEIAAALKKVKR